MNEKSSINLTKVQFLEACSQPGCPQCRVINRGLEKYLDNLFYENVNNPTVRTHLRKSLGFCRKHARLIMEKRMGDALGISIIYRDIVANLLKRLPDFENPLVERMGMDGIIQGFQKSGAKQINNIIGWIKPKDVCLVCQQEKKLSDLVLGVIANYIREDGFIQVLSASEGFCLFHLKVMFERIRDLNDLNPIMSMEKAKFEKLHEELSEYIRKNDYRFRGEGFGSEKDAWRRALDLISLENPRTGSDEKNHDR